MRVRPRPRRPVPPSTLQQPPYPLATTIRVQPHPAPRCPCPVDAQLAHVTIAPLAAPSPGGLATRGVLLRHSPSPSGKLTTILQHPNTPPARQRLMTSPGMGPSSDVDAREACWPGCRASLG